MAAAETAAALVALLRAAPGWGSRSAQTRPSLKGEPLSGNQSHFPAEKLIAEGRQEVRNEGRPAGLWKRKSLLLQRMMRLD